MSVSAHDPLLARLVEQAGFQVVGLSGNAIAAAYLGIPDMGFLNLGDMANVTRRIASAVSIPLLVDANTGYGNAMSVLRTVRESLSSKESRDEGTGNHVAKFRIGGRSACHGAGGQQYGSAATGTFVARG